MDPFNISSQHPPYLRPSVCEKSKTDPDDRIVDLLELVIRYIIWFAAAMAILKVFNIDITPLLAAAGIVGIAVALTAQDFISNFFGGAIITVDKPFKVGDRIRVENYYGDVISVGTRSTRIKTQDYQIVTIPNNKLTSNFIINFSEPDQKLRITIPIAVAYGSDPGRVKEILLEVAQDAIKNTEYLLADPPPAVFFTEFAESILNFIIRVRARKYSLSDEVQDTINCRIAERFAQEEIEIPFPQMDVHFSPNFLSGPVGKSPRSPVTHRISGIFCSLRVFRTISAMFYRDYSQRC
ncbi:MAG: mechanosensitive ion channel family protein [Methanoregula sp.]